MSDAIDQPEIERFEIRVDDNHHHLVCRRCGAVADVPCAVGGIPCAVPDDTRGYAIDEAEVTYWGLCASCQAAATHSGEDPRYPSDARERTS